MTRPLRNNNVVRIKAAAGTKALLDRAAALRGQKLSEFILESALCQADETVLDQRAFFPDPKAHQRFLAWLDRTAKPALRVKSLMKRKPAWRI